MESPRRGRPSHDVREAVSRRSVIDTPADGDEGREHEEAMEKEPAQKTLTEMRRARERALFTRRGASVRQQPRRSIRGALGGAGERATS